MTKTVKTPVAAPAEVVKQVTCDVLTDPFDIIRNAELVDSTMQYYVVMVDAELARNLLVYNVEPGRGLVGTNRKASQVRIDTYRSAMGEGEWRINPHAVVISGPNAAGIYALTDGQQRLKAVIEADKKQPGIRVPLVVCLYAPPESMDVMDQGKAKLPADFLKMHGIANGTLVSSALRIVYLYDEVPFDSPHSWQKTRLSVSKYLQLNGKYEGMNQAVLEASVARKTLSPSLGAALWYLMKREYGPFVASKFFEGIKFESSVTSGPLKDLRLFLGNKRLDGHVWEPVHLLALLIVMANAWINGNDRADPKKIFRAPPKTMFPRLISGADVTEERLRLLTEGAKVD